MAKNEAKIKFTAETGGFNQSIKSAKDQISALSAEMKLNDAQMKSSGQTVAGLEQKQKLLQEQYKQQQNVVEALNGKLQKAVECFGENSTEATKLRTQLANAQTAEERIQQSIAKCNSELEAQRAAESRTRTETEKLNGSIEKQQSEVNKLKQKYVEAVLKFGDTSDEAKDLAQKISTLSGELAENKRKVKDAGDAADKLDKSIDDAGDSAKNASDGGFTVLKGALADLTSNAIQGAISKVNEMVSSLLELPEATRELRQDLSTLTTAYNNVGFATETATDTWRELYSVFGEDDRAVETANNIARMAKNQQELNEWVTITTGIWGTYQDALPVEGLAEAAGETAKTGKVTGVLADALNWSSEAAAMFAGYMSEDVTNAEDAFNAALSECNTEAERQALITSTLTKLYGKSADTYRQTAKSVIAANKATADLTLEQAKLGDVVEPVTTEITGFKTELVKGLSPAIKKDVLPAVKGFFGSLKDNGTINKFSKGVSSIAKTVLPPLGKALKFVAENIDTLAGVTLGAVTAFSAFKAVMLVTTAVTAAKTAIEKLSAGVGIATKAQTLWNAAMAANPIGAVLTAVGLLTAGIAMLVSSQKEAETQTDSLSESQRESVKAAEEQAQAFRETKKAADETAQAHSAQIDYVKTLWGELQTLADENGRVKDTDKARAEFILNELNSALGTEYSLNGNIITSYTDMKKSIEEVIKTKKAQLLLEAYENSYKEAIKEVSKAEQDRAIKAQELYAAQAAYEEKQKKAVEERAALTEAANNARTESEYRALAATAEYVSKLEAEAEKEKGIYEKKKSAYDKADATVKQVYANIDGYETASTLLLAGETDKAIQHLERLNGGYKTAEGVAAKTKDEQIRLLKEQVVETEVNLGILQAEYDNAQENMTEAERQQALKRIENAKAQAKQAKDEYYKVGGNMVEGMARGAKDGEWSLTGSLKSTVANALKAAKKALGIHSPSRVFKKEVGLNIDYGIAEGIDSGTGSVLKTIDTQTKEIEGAYKSLKTSGVNSLIKTPSLETSVNTNLNTALDKSMQMLNMSQLISAIEALANRAIDLNINGHRFATATAADTDTVNGGRISLKNRGLAL